MSNNTQFYYNLNGNNAGPVSSEELIELAKNGTIDRDTLIWRQGYKDWKKLSDSEIDISFLPPPVKPVTIPTPPAMPNSTQKFNAANNVIPTNSENPFMYYVNAFKQYANFNGRARRKEYWFFSLFHLLIIILLCTLEMLIGIGPTVWLDYSTPITIPVLTIIYCLAAFIPVLAITARRLHDTGKSGWWQLLSLIPFVNYIGSIVILVFVCFDSQVGENKYGANPKGLN